jgi:hypothetical protein
MQQQRQRMNPDRGCTDRRIGFQPVQHRPDRSVKQVDEASVRPRISPNDARGFRSQRGGQQRNDAPNLGLQVIRERVDIRIEG